MSRLGRKPIIIPAEVEVKLENNELKARGPKGEASLVIDRNLAVKLEGDQLRIEPRLGENGQMILQKSISARQGLFWALAANLIRGVNRGFERSLVFQGVGFRATADGHQLELNLGFSHPIKLPVPSGIAFRVEKNKIVVSGIDKELVGRVAAQIKSFRRPEPYKGSGIRYEEEVIVKKAGKKAITAG